MHLSMVMKKIMLKLYFLFIFICTGMKENQGQKETNKALDWLVSFTDMYFPSNAVAVSFFLWCARRCISAKNSNPFTTR